MCVCVLVDGAGHARGVRCVRVSVFVTCVCNVSLCKNALRFTCLCVAFAVFGGSGGLRARVHVLPDRRHGPLALPFGGRNTRAGASWVGGCFPLYLPARFGAPGVDGCLFSCARAPASALTLARSRSLSSSNAGSLSRLLALSLSCLRTRFFALSMGSSCARAFRFGTGGARRAKLGSRRSLTSSSWAWANP